MSAARTPAERIAAAGLVRHRLGPVCWVLTREDGTEVGRYGGRAGYRWARLADGTRVTEMASSPEFAEHSGADLAAALLAEFGG